MTVEEWRLVARAMAAHDVVDPGGDTHWADHMFGARAKQFIAAFDAVMEFRGPPKYVTGVDPPNEPADDDIERVARRMARSSARDSSSPVGVVDQFVDEFWPSFRDAAAEHLNQLRSGNA